MQKYGFIPIHNKADFIGMRKAGKLAADTLDYIEQFVKPGVTTEELDSICAKFIKQHDGISAPLGYHGFPKSICTSINHIVCHGIPSDKAILQDGDIIGIDVTPILDGWHGDSCKTFVVGDSFIKKNNNVARAVRLVKVTYEAMIKGIEMIKPGNTFGDMSMAIDRHAKANNFSVVRDYGGHGIGKVFHTQPNISHYYDESDIRMNVKFEPGMFFTVEPMINAGNWQIILSKIDGWTVTTRDKSLSAQFEHTIGVTEDGCEIFTISRNNQHFQDILNQW